MLSLSILAFLLLPLSNSNALLIPKTLDSDTTQTNVLGPVTQLYIANNFIAPDGYNRS